MSAWKISIRFAIKDIATVVSLKFRSFTHRLGTRSDGLNNTRHTARMRPLPVLFQGLLVFC
jgi:hypothetical protein